MTTTASALSGLYGAGVQFVAAIEGYEHLLTDCRSVNDIADAWDATEWSGKTPLTGAFFDWSRMKQSIAPWDTRISPMSITISVMDCTGLDTFGVDTHATMSGNETKLASDMNTTDTTTTVLSTSAFSSSGSFYVGQERVDYTAKGAASFTGCTRGLYAPFKAGSESLDRFARNHAIPHYANVNEAKVPPPISSTPRNWIGKWVGVWMHARIGGLLNAKADAQLMFAGTITSVGDSSNGMTVIEVTEARNRIQDAVLLNDQLVGVIAEGITLRTGMVFTAYDHTSTAGSNKSTTLTVLTGASTNYQCAPGIYTLAEFENVINTWLQQAKTDSALNFRWNYQAAVTTSGGVRGRFSWEHTTAAIQKTTNLTCNVRYPLAFMGWGASGPPVTELDYGNSTWSTTSPEEPYRLLYEYSPNITYTTITLDSSAGTWVDNTDVLPASLRPFPSSSTSQWGVLKLSSGTHVMAHYESATSYTVFASPGLAALGASPWDQALTDGLRFTDAGNITVTQVVLMEGTFADLVTKVLASTGVSTYNGSYDALSVQLGCAIPWALLGTNWTDSITALGSAGSGQAMLVYLDKPRKFWDVIKAELLLRRASIVWNNGGLRIATWSTPTATTATWDLTESNKSSPTGTVDAQRSPSQTSDEYQYNTLKLEYNRDIGGTYRDSITIVDRAAVSDGERAITVQCANAFSGYASTGQGVEELAAQAAAWLPMFSRPVRKVRRSIGLEHVCTMAPGDICNVTDNFARDPSTGIRGLTAVPGLIVSVSWDLGGADPSGGAARDFVGEIDIVLEPGRRIAPYSPCAEVEYGAGGYNAGTKVLTLQAHAHSETSMATDVSNFDVGDKVNIVEIDPANGAAPRAWADTIAAIGTNTATMTTGLAGFSATERYRMLSAVYTTAVSTQKSDTYQALEDTGIISGLAQAYVYGYGMNAASWTATTVSQPVSLYSNYSYGDGMPLDTGYERDVAELVNNLVNYRTAPIGPTLNTTTMVSSSGSYQRHILHILPFYVGPGSYSARKRLLSIAPFARNTEASTKHLYVTFARRPPTGSSLIWPTAALPESTIPSPSVSLDFSLSASAGWAALTAQTLDCRIADPDTGIGFLILEGTKGIETRGYARLDLGPLVAQ